VQGKGFPYHFLPLVPPLALLAGLAATALAERSSVPARGPPWGFTAAAGFLLGLLLLPPSSRIARSTLRWGVAASSPERLAAYEQAEYGFFGHADSPEGRIGAWIRGHSAPADRVQVWGMKAVLYAPSERRAPTRFGTSQPLVSGAGSEFRERYRTEFLDRITTQPPRFVVTRRAELCVPPARVVELECLQAFPDFARFVEARYRIATVVQDFAVWELGAAGRESRQSSMR
jgi:hypothetical protein